MEQYSTQLNCSDSTKAHFTGTSAGLGPSDLQLQPGFEVHAIRFVSLPCLTFLFPLLAFPKNISQINYIAQVRVKYLFPKHSS